LRDFDVIVVGGGCAGLWSAFVAAGRGARTLLIEREPRIGDKIRCAEGVGSKGISRFVEVRDDWIAARVRGGRFCSPDGLRIDADEPGCGFVLHKDLFLRGLAERAEGAGVEVWTGSTVSGLKPLEGGGFEVAAGMGSGSRTLRCGSVIAADGIESGIARMAGLDTCLKPDEIFICAQETLSPVEADPGLVEFHFGTSVAPGGYAWVFPKGDGRANVGVGITYREGRGRARDYLEKFKGARCRGARVERHIAGGVPAVKMPPKAFWRGLFLAGDAARAPDPVSGAGIIPAMESAAVSGRFAAAYAMGEKAPGDVEREFGKRHHDVFKGRKLRYSLKTILTRLSDEEFSRVVSLIGEYSSSGGSLQTPGNLIKFFVKSMPGNFGMLRHLVGV
jgi:digeranylgeranylglycerophospholipid reductase